MKIRICRIDEKLYYCCSDVFNVEPTALWQRMKSCCPQPFPILLSKPSGSETIVWSSSSDLCHFLSTMSELKLLYGFTLLLETHSFDSISEIPTEIIIPQSPAHLTQLSFAEQSPEQQAAFIQMLTDQSSIETKSILSKTFEQSKKQKRGVATLGPRQRRVREAEAWRMLHEIAQSTGNLEWTESEEEPVLLDDLDETNCSSEQLDNCIQTAWKDFSLSSDLLVLIGDLYRSHREYFESARSSISSGKTIRKTSHRQLNILRRIFHICVYPTTEQVDQIASLVFLDRSEVIRWFQNARSRSKRFLERN